MNFFDLNIKIKGKLYRHYKYDKIIKDQALIAYVLHVPIHDTDDICPYDRELLIESIKEIQEAKSSSNLEY